MIKFFNIFFVLCFASISALAEELSAITLQYETLNNSDSVSQNSFDFTYRSHRRDFNYSFEEEAEEAFDWGLRGNLVRGKNSNYAFQKYFTEFSAAYKVSSGQLFEIALGAGDLADTNAVQHKFLNLYRFNYQFTDLDYFSGGLFVEHDLYSDVFIPGDLAAQPLALSYSGNLTWNVQKNLKLNLSGKKVLLQDDNEKTVSDLSSMYGISTGSPWIWIGLGLERTAFLKVFPGYWSPSEFNAFGVRTEFAFDLKNEYSLRGGVNYNMLNDKDSGADGAGHYASVVLQKGDRNKLNYSIGMIDIESVQKSTKWREQHWTINLNSFF